MGIIVSSIVIVLIIHTTSQEQENVLPKIAEYDEGETAKVGGIAFQIKYLGTGDNIGIEPNGTFFVIQITAENLMTNPLTINKNQFILLDDQGRLYGTTGIGQNELQEEEINPNVPVILNARFDIQYDDKSRYRLAIMPLEEHEEKNPAVICVKKC